MIALMPLDSRPCNVRFPRQIAAIGGSDLLTPPMPLLGRFNTPGRPDALCAWLRDLPPVEALIVSVDMLAYGGLVASRRPSIKAVGALDRLQVIRDFRAKRPDVPIYAFNILMRLAITMDGDEAVANYYNIMRYARLVDEAERFDSSYLRDELRKVTADIPAPVLQEYLAARARNHAVNLRMIDWLADGVFDYLLITQEDATEFGLHRREQDDLMRRVAERGVTEKMSLHPGADEAALTLLARHWNSGVRFRVHWSSREDAHHIAPFEDRPFDESLVQHVAAMRGVLVDDKNGKADSNSANDTDEPVDFHLFVNAPVGVSQKDESEGDRALRAARLMNFIRDLAALAESADPTGATAPRVALCDVAFPNGADNVLMTELEKRRLFSRLSAYSGWNTAGNTTGTVLAQCAALKKVQDRGLKAEDILCDVPSVPSHILRPSAFELNRQFVFERLVDDWFYQSQVRAHIEKSAREQGISPLNMGQAYGPVEAQARRELRGFAQLLAKRHFGAAVQNSEISLPWGRTFEADVRVNLT
jgi:Protein of unknown function (DUF4127)